MSIGQDYQVSESPLPTSFGTLLPILRQHAHVINLLVLGAEVINTSSLPAAGAANDGRIVIENAGGAVRNLIIYSSGVRTRYTGTNF